MLAFKSISQQVLFALIGVVSFTISYLIIPQIKFIVKHKRLLDKPNERSTHKHSTATLGGIAFIPGIYIALYLIDYMDFDNVGMSIVLGVIFMGLLGIRDDLMGVSPRVKILFQAVIVVLAMLSGKAIYVSSFDGFLSVGEIPLVASYALAIFAVVVIVNSYNLIDGINGLAGMLGFVMFASFAFVFYKSENYFYTGLCSSASGSLLGFLRYNTSSKSKDRIFMGDTGSMIMGVILGFCSLKFLSLSPQEFKQAGMEAQDKFIVLISILIVMFMDTSRVFTIRTIKTGNPFYPDRNHIHHIIVDYTALGHIKTSLILATFNTLVFALIYSLSGKVSTLALVAVLFLVFVMATSLLFYINRNYGTKRIKYKIRKMFRKK